MVILRFIQICITVFICAECNSQKKIICEDLKINDIFSTIDTTKIYSISPIDKETNSFLQFKKNGEIIYFSKTNYNNSIVQVPSKYRKGKYYLDKDNKHIVLREDFKHPQGGGWVKKILSDKNNDILVFRFENSCNERIKLIPLN